MGFCQGWKQVRRAAFGYHYLHNWREDTIKIIAIRVSNVDVLTRCLHVTVLMLFGVLDRLSRILALGMTTRKIHMEVKLLEAASYRAKLQSQHP